MRESHQPELRRALEEGVWSDGEPPLHTFVSGAPLQQPDRVRIRAWAEVTDHFTIVDPRCVDALSPFYVWTPDYAEKRLGWRGRQPLHVLLLRTYRIPRPVTVKVKDEYTGPERLDRAAARTARSRARPVLSDAEFERASEEIRAITARSAASRSWSSCRGSLAVLQRFARGLGAGLGDEHVARADHRRVAGRSSRAEHARDALLEQQAGDELGLRLGLRRGRP